MASIQRYQLIRPGSTRLVRATESRFLWISLAVLVAVATLLLPSLAFADATVSFTALDVRAQANDDLQIEYAVGKRSWKTIRKHNVDPTLVVFSSSTGDRGSYDFAYSFPLTARTGLFEVPASAGIRGGHELKIGVVGFDADWRIGAVAYDGAEGARLNVAVPVRKRGKRQPVAQAAEWYLWIGGEQFGPVTARRVERMFNKSKIDGNTYAWHAALGDWHLLRDISTFQELFVLSRGPGGNLGHHGWTTASVIQACGDALSSGSAENGCLDAVSSAVYDPTAMIDACERAMEGDDNELACIQTSSSAWSDPSAVIDACELAMEGDANELGCVSLAVGASFDVTSSIAACELAMEGDDNELACIALVAQGFHDASESIVACEQAMNGDAAELGCIERVVL